jgi:hypothetical protein
MSVRYHPSVAWRVEELENSRVVCELHEIAGDHREVQLWQAEIQCHFKLWLAFQRTGTRFVDEVSLSYDTSTFDTMYNRTHIYKI